MRHAVDGGARGRLPALRSVCGVIAVAAVGSVVGLSSAQADTPPYSLPVTLPAASATSPPVDAQAPYTPVVLDLIDQLEPDDPPTRAEIANASRLLHGGTNAVTPGAFQNPSCHNVGPVSAPTGTDPSIMPICWTDAQGILHTSGPLRAVGTTGPMTLMGLGSSFDLDLANVWGQTEGTESREYMITGLFGPQTDLDRQPNWGRNLTTTGEDPFLSRRMVAAQINGIQGVGTMSQMKHFAVYNGQNQNANTDVQDQALHEQYLTPYEGGFLDGRAAATMCSYQLLRDKSPYLPATVSSLTQPSPFGTLAPPTWNLNESHFACEQPLLENYVLRDLWHSKAFIGSDYPATHSTSGILQGEDQEMPPTQGFFSETPMGQAAPGFGNAVPTDPTGSTCADPSGNQQVSCSSPGAVHAGGIPGPGCVPGGCTLVDAVMNGTIPLTVFNQALARILYQEERFGMLGCDQTPVSPLCTNPGGIAGDRSGAVQIPDGPTSGAPQLGTKNGDAAVVERYSEEGAVLLKNQGNRLPLKSSDLNGGILVTGPGANHTIADPTNEASLGFPDRDAINPLQQLKAFSGQASAFTYAPANDPTGYTVPATALWPGASPPPTTTPPTLPTPTTGGLSRTAGPGSPTIDRTLDFTTASPAGQLAPGTYTWSGFVYVPTSDTYTFDLQSTASLGASAVTVSFDGTSRTLSLAPSVWAGANCSPVAPGNPFSASCSVPGSPTTAGFTEGGLYNQQFVAGGMAAGTYHAITITFDNTSGGPASFRFGYTRAQGDIDDAAAAARNAKMAIVFLNDAGATTTTANPYATGPATISAPESLTAANTNLIEAVAAANPNTIVVLNTTNPILMPWRDAVKGILEMWFAGQEGGTSTARLLLGLANPSGHTSLSWPAHATDTLWAYDQPFGLYPGDTPGPHLERLNGSDPSCLNPAAPAPTVCTNETEGIFTGYKYLDRMGIEPMFPFGYGLSYTTFTFSNLNIAPSGHEADVSFDVTNTGQRAGAEVAQVYVGTGPNVPGVQQAVRSLEGFQRLQLGSGETRRVTVHLPERAFQYWDEAGQSWRTNWGQRTIYVGDADAPANLPLSGQLLPSGGPPPPGGGTTPPPAIDRRVSIKRATLRVDRKRHVKVRIRCGPTVGNTCKGIVQLLWTGKNELARRSFSVRVGAYRTVTLTVKRQYYRRLRHKALRISVIVLTRGSDGVLRRAAQRHVRIVRR